MLRNATWNKASCLAFPDNGVEVNGTHWLVESVQLDYAV